MKAVQTKAGALHIIRLSPVKMVPHQFSRQNVKIVQMHHLYAAFDWIKGIISELQLILNNSTSHRLSNGT